jgi:hypothetical protein
VLSKAVCEGCRRYGGHDYLWENGWCVCTLCGIEQNFKVENTGEIWQIKTVSVKREPPKECPFAVEHVVSQEK